MCAQCLADAAAYDGADADLTLSATAFARDLADTHRADATTLLRAAARAAIAYLDRSELDARSFAIALRRLATLRDASGAKLAPAIA